MKENYCTGANGFVGKHLCQRLSLTPIPHENIPIYKFNDFDRLFFLSSYGNLAHQRDFEETINANTLNPIDVFTRTLSIKYQSFVYFSSSSVTLPNQTAYSRSKLATEQILLAGAENLNKPICIIRPYSITGVGEQDCHLIPRLIKSCETGTRMNFVPEPTHDFIDVEDVVEATDLLSSRSATGIFELGTGIPTTNQKVREIVEDVTGRKANVIIVDSMRGYDNNDWFCRRNLSEFGWKPKKTLEQSITEMVTDFRRTQQND